MRVKIMKNAFGKKVFKVWNFKGEGLYLVDVYGLGILVDMQNRI